MKQKVAKFIFILIFIVKMKLFLSVISLFYLREFLPRDNKEAETEG